MAEPSGNKFEIRKGLKETVEKVNRREEKKMEMKGFRKHRLNIEMYMC
jgi:hypothetical protein